MKKQEMSQKSHVIWQWLSRIMIAYIETLSKSYCQHYVQPGTGHLDTKVDEQQEPTP